MSVLSICKRVVSIVFWCKVCVGKGSEAGKVKCNQKNFDDRGGFRRAQQATLCQAGLLTLYLI